MELTTLLLSAVTSILLLKLVSIVYKYYLWNKKYSKIPTPSTRIPLIGWSWEVRQQKREDRDNWLREIADTFKDGIFRSWLGNPTVHINRPYHAEILLRNTKEINKSLVYKFMEPWLGFGLLNSSGQKWTHDRKLITPAFHFGILEEFAEVMVEKAAILNKRLDKHMKTIGDKYFDAFDMIGQCALDIIYETALGMNVHAQDDIENDYIQAVHTISTSIINRAFRPWLLFDFIFYRTALGKNFQAAIDIAHEKCNSVIEHKQAERKMKNKQGAITPETEDEFGKRKRRAFLDLLLEASEKNIRPLTIEEIREQVNTFMFAGHDTTSALISWSLFCIANDEEVQKQLHNELDDIFGDSDEPTTTEKVAEMNYLDRVIKETLRLYPSATAISRNIKEDLQVGEYLVPAGCNLVLHIYQLHLNPEVWPNPMHFDPDRFLPENSRNRHPYAYVPFSAGPRNCIGQKFAHLEAKIVLSELMRKWKVHSRDTHKTMKSYTAIIRRPHEGMFLKFEKRR